jgi:hypothetical protein
VPEHPDRLPEEPDRRYSEGQETDDDSGEKTRIGNFASREASSEEIGPLGEPVGHDHAGGHRDHGREAERPGSVAGDALADDAVGGTGGAGHGHRSDLRGDLTAGMTDAVIGPDFDASDRHDDVDDQEDRPEQERHRRFSEGQEYAGETPEKERQGDFATGQREDDES